MIQMIMCEETNKILISVNNYTTKWGHSTNDLEIDDQYFKLVISIFCTYYFCCFLLSFLNLHITQRIPEESFAKVHTRLDKTFF